MITGTLNNLINIQARNFRFASVRLIISLRNLQSGMNRLIGQKIRFKNVSCERNKIFYSWNHLKISYETLTSSLILIKDYQK
jgi:hypothetical protein